VPYSTTAYPEYRSNPDWGPTLYNPLDDDNHDFKDDSHYEKTIAKLRRNPDSRCSRCGKVRRFNPEEGTGLFTSLFARRNPPASIENATNALAGQGLFKSIFSRRNPTRWTPHQHHGRRRGRNRHWKYGV